MRPLPSRLDSQPALPLALRQRLSRLRGRLPGYALFLGTVLRRRHVPAAYSQALAQEAGFGRLPAPVPGRMLPGFRSLGRVALVGVVLHVLLQQSGGGTRRRTRSAAGLSIAGLRDDAGTILAFGRWALLGLVGRRARLRSGA